jgi:plasmid stabilization system protein ParE
VSLRVEFLSRADADLQEAFDRFENCREGFGVEFMMAVDAYLARIAAFPEIAPIYLESVRRQVMQRFPYGIFYEPQPARILITAILDLRQDEQLILRRLWH